MAKHPTYIHFPGDTTKIELTRAVRLLVTTLEDTTQRTADLQVHVSHLSGPEVTIPFTIPLENFLVYAGIFHPETRQRIDPFVLEEAIYEHPEIAHLSRARADSLHERFNAYTLRRTGCSSTLLSNQYFGLLRKLSEIRDHDGDFLTMPVVTPLLSQLLQNPLLYQIRGDAIQKPAQELDVLIGEFDRQEQNYENIPEQPGFLSRKFTQEGKEQLTARKQELHQVSLRFKDTAKAALEALKKLGQQLRETYGEKHREISPTSGG